ncbi:hypothetical protein HS088_TW01G00309 [Tripterygium wilfordii]|uniref:RRM domain-containing protein n=1 Tax=Tripterygium wilfordii TaxID=458696 RepID=A0A7J7E179_TRIWF|nr:uncharacterized protein LOC120015737 [Tripterygium wilfordii]KAF5752400.1 hypothetical protein HS088_TW01G00309 [Tripterygium wilfordii]
MALFRLLLLKQGFRSNTRGLIMSTRSCSSLSGGTEAPNPNHLERLEEKGEFSVDSSSKKCSEIHSGVFSKATHVQSKVVGSWNSLKGIFTVWKGKITRQPQFQKQITNETLESKVDSKASEVIMMQHQPDATCNGKSHAVFQSVDSKECVTTSSTLHLTGKCASENIVDTTASENSVDDTTSDVIKMYKNTDNVELSEPDSIVQSLEVRNENENENGYKQLEGAMTCAVVEVDRNQKKKAEKLSSPTAQLPREGFKTVGEGMTKFTPFKMEKLLKKKIVTSPQTAPAVSNEGEILLSSDGSQKDNEFVELFLRKTNGQNLAEMTNENSAIVTPSDSLETSSKTSMGDVGKNIKDLIDCIKILPAKQSSRKSQDRIVATRPTTGQVGTKDLGKKIKSCIDLHNAVIEGRQTSFHGHPKSKENKQYNENKVIEEPGVKIPLELCTNAISQFERGDEGGDVNTRAHDLMKQELVSHSSTTKENLNQTMDTGGHMQNRVLLRLLHHSVTNDDIMNAFTDCGPILKIEEIWSFKDSKFKDAFVYFKRRKGLRKALKKTDLLVRSTDAFMEAPSSLEGNPNKISIPNLIGDPDVPVELVKNPTQTVKIKQWTGDISSHQLIEALSFCGSGITILGSSNSVAYVEFETEDAKERAIVEHSISVFGKQLFIFRIDVPRTTVIRLSNIKKRSENIRLICNSHGKVKNMFWRGKGLVDVQFKLSEWPNMSSILNRLNGLVVDGRRWVAVPAPVFPPAILNVLWSDPDGKRHVKATVDSLMRKLGNVDMEEFTSLSAMYFGKEF